MSAKVLFWCDICSVQLIRGQTPVINRGGVFVKEDPKDEDYFNKVICIGCVEKIRRSENSRMCENKYDEDLTK